MPTLADPEDGVETASVRNVRCARRFDDSLYTHPAYLQCQGYGSPEELAGSGGETALFRRQGRGLVHLGRLEPMSGAAIAAYAETAFGLPDTDFVVFEDIRLEDDAPAGSRGRQILRYQANWRRTLTPRTGR